MPLFIALALGLGGLFVGSQLDDAVEEAIRPPSAQPAKLPLIITIPSIVALSAAAFFLIKKIIK